MKIVKGLLPWTSSTDNEKTPDTMSFDENKLISLKENFTNQKFQWIKTDRPELIGKVVRCRDVHPNRLGGFDVVFDDGSKIDSTKLNSNLMMIHGDAQPLSRSEVEAIQGPKPKINSQPANTSQPQVQVTQSQPVVNQSQVQSQVQPQVPPQPAQVTHKTNMFAMFNSEESQISVALKVRLPDKKLLKMMYASAENKDKFLDELSEYLQSVINKQVIADSMKESLDPTPVKKKEAAPASPHITVREV